MSYEPANPDYVGYPHEQEDHDGHVKTYYRRIFDMVWWQAMNSDPDWIFKEEQKDELL